MKIPINREREEQLLAALSHASLAVYMVGIVLPLGVWLSQREKSSLLRFQALQAAAYQFIGLMLYFLWMGVYFFGIFGFISSLLWEPKWAFWKRPRKMK